MKTCYSYIRVSTDEQAQEGYSLDNQQKACRDYALSHGYHVKRQFADDGKSGRTTEREAFQELLTSIDENKVDALIIYKIDRFARNVSDFRNIKKEIEAKGVEMISVLEGNITQGSSLIANILASVAEWESEVNGNRTRDALMQKFRDGWQPTPPPIGYRSVGGDKQRKTCEPDPYEAPIIKQLFEMYATGNYSILGIQDWLADKNILSRKGTPLGHSVICNILNNPFYFGQIRWHGQSKRGKHASIISKDLFEVCQYVLLKHRDFLLRKRVHDFLLRGFVTCAECGQRYTAEWHINEKKFRSRGGKIAYYHCQKRDHNNCSAPYVEMNNLEKQVEEQFKKMEFTKEFISLVMKKVKEKLEANRKISLLNKQSVINLKTSLETRRNKLEDSLLDETIDRETYKRKHNELELKIQNAESRVKEIEDSCRIDMNLIEEILSLTRNIYKTYIDAPPFLKRHYMRFFFERFEVKNRVIINAVPTPIFLVLQENHAVIIRNVGLPPSD
ncbi:hypothetical protein B6D29_00090 [Microgenomates bacterium UTCPR1]|nr:MAG: hypothetical protein B6D29_00090 [Microgenomates bacterium UTCPR1]